MTPHQVVNLAESLTRPILGAGNVETIVVHEDEDPGGTPSLSVDVFVAPGTLPVGSDVYLRIRRGLSDALAAEGESRFAYLRLRDKRGERELEGPSEND